MSIIPASSTGRNTNDGRTNAVTVVTSPNNSIHPPAGRPRSSRAKATSSAMTLSVTPKVERVSVSGVALEVNLRQAQPIAGADARPQVDRCPSCAGPTRTASQ